VEQGGRGTSLGKSFGGESLKNSCVEQAGEAPRQNGTAGVAADNPVVAEEAAAAEAGQDGNGGHVDAASAGCTASSQRTGSTREGDDGQACDVTTRQGVKLEEGTQGPNNGGGDMEMQDMADGTVEEHSAAAPVLAGSAR
jgi:hypothetical protein